MNVCPPPGSGGAGSFVTDSIKPIYRGRALTLNEERVAFPDGSHGTLEIVRHPGGAGAVALDERGRVCLIRQYRYAADGWLWEIPAGRLEPNEAPLLTAQRELAEEAGLRAADWQSLGSLLSTPGVCDERIHLYLARELSAAPMAHEDEEFIEIHWVPFPEAIQWACTGKINDAKTLIALYRVRHCLNP